uniref:Uncharacterized protein n=1 Tax=Arundo donax TaxID=35708 RepID=A0A0A9F8E7_ARUDO
MTLKPDCAIMHYLFCHYWSLVSTNPLKQLYVETNNDIKNCVLELSNVGCIKFSPFFKNPRLDTVLTVNILSRMRWRGKHK